MPKQTKLIIKSHIGDIITDDNDKEYIDMGSIIFVTNLGGNNFGVRENMLKQMNEENIYTYHYMSEARKEAERRVIHLTGMSDVFFYSSGTQANEAMLKIIQAQNPQKQLILSLKGNYHGNTWGAELLNGFYYHSNFIQMPYPTKESNFYRDLARMRINVDAIGGIIVQAYRGYDCNFVPEEYMKQLSDSCKYNNMVLAWDDIQAGFGRTGKLFSWENYGIRPDVATIGKALGNGYPISAVVGNRMLFNKCRYALSSTHSGSALGCAAVNSVCSQIEQAVKDAEYGYFNERMRDLSAKTRHRGMVGAILFSDTETADRLCDRCFDRGVLLVHTGRNTVKIGPALTMSKETMKNGFDIIESELKKICM